MSIRLLAMDLDGTSLLEDHKSFSPKLHQALLDAHDKGVLIVPTTGRQFSMLPPAVKTGAPWEQYGILCNGAEVRNLITGELLAAQYLTAEQTLFLLSLGEAMELSVEFSCGGRLYYTEASYQLEKAVSPIFPFHFNEVLPSLGHITDNLPDFLSSCDTTTEKVVFPYVPEEKRASLEAALEGHSLSFVWSGAYSLEITHEKATKGNGLLTLAAMLSIDPSELMAIGDSGNDVPMLKAAHLGVAMGNAPDFVKAAADKITTSHTEDGVALAIESYIL